MSTSSKTQFACLTSTTRFTNQSGQGFPATADVGSDTLSATAEAEAHQAEAHLRGSRGEGVTLDKNLVATQVQKIKKDYE